MNNFDQTIYCDKNTQILSNSYIRDLVLKQPNMLVVDHSNVSGVSFTKTRYSDMFWLYTNDTIIGQSLRYYGEYTELEIELLKNFIKPHFTVYDVGANIGYHTLAFSKLAQDVYAFEPNKKNLELLRKNAGHCDNVVIYDFACSDKNTTMYVEDFDTTKPGNYGEMRMLDNGQECQSMRIDDIADIFGPDLIKIDVEGHELQVLNGSIETITQYKPIIFYEAHGTELPEIYDLLTGLDYTLYWYPCRNYNPNNYLRNSTNVFGQGGVVNILATPNSKYGNITNLIKVNSRIDTIQNAIKRAIAQQENI